MAGRMVLVFAKIRWFHRHKIATFCHNITGPQDQEWRIVRQQTLRFHPKKHGVFSQTGTGSLNVYINLSKKGRWCAMVETSVMFSIHEIMIPLV